MSGSASDATRFTATFPHAYSKPSPLRSAASNTFSPSSIPRPQNPPAASRPPSRPSGPGNSQETPAQKVARLRAQRAALRDAQIPVWDKVVVTGRVWADRLHRVTVLSLITFTVIATGAGLFSITDMLIYNRRKRNEFYHEQRLLYQQRLVEARQASATGTATDDQILVLNQERARTEAEQARLKKEGMWTTSKRFLLGGMKQEQEQETENQPAATSDEMHTHALETGQEIKSHQREIEGIGISAAVEIKRREGEKALEDRGVGEGPLDIMAEQAVKAATAEIGKGKGGWTSWLSWR